MAVPFAVVTIADTGTSEAADSVTVNVALTVPVLPSGTDVSPIVNEGGVGRTAFASAGSRATAILLFRLVEPTTTTCPVDASTATARAKSSPPKSSSNLPPLPNPSSGVESVLIRRMAKSLEPIPDPASVFPTTMILPLGMMATPFALSELDGAYPKSYARIPLPKNDGSSAPAVVTRATRKSPYSARPATTILPLACKATACARLPLP